MVFLSHLPVVDKGGENWIAHRALLPIENSLGGSIHQNYDLLLRHCYILLTNHGVKIEDLTRVLSHPQAVKKRIGRDQLPNTKRGPRTCCSGANLSNKDTCVQRLFCCR